MLDRPGATTTGDGAAPLLLVHPQGAAPPTCDATACPMTTRRDRPGHFSATPPHRCRRHHARPRCGGGYGNCCAGRPVAVLQVKETRLQADRRDGRAGAGHIGRRQNTPALRHFIRHRAVHRGRPGDARHVDDHCAGPAADRGRRCLRFHGHDRSGTQSVPDGCHQGVVDPGPRPVHAERRDRSVGVRRHARRRQGPPPTGADRPARRPREGRRHPPLEARRGLLRTPADAERFDGSVRHHAG